MKIAAIIMGVLSLLLVAGAAFRLATLGPDTQAIVPLFDQQSDPPVTAAQRSSPTTQPANSSKQQDIADHLRGNSWEQEGDASDINMTEEEEFDRAEEVLDNREEDLDDAKGKIKGLL